MVFATFYYNNPSAIIFNCYWTYTNPNIQKRIVIQTASSSVEQQMPNISGTNYIESIDDDGFTVNKTSVAGYLTYIAF